MNPTCLTCTLSAHHHSATFQRTLASDTIAPASSTGLNTLTPCPPSCVEHTWTIPLHRTTSIPPPSRHSIVLHTTPTQPNPTPYRTTSSKNPLNHSTTPLTRISTNPPNPPHPTNHQPPTPLQAAQPNTITTPATTQRNPSTPRGVLTTTGGVLINTPPAGSY